MKRDMELMREILFEIEKNYEAGNSKIMNLDVYGYDLKTIAEHCDLLYQAGLINTYEPTHYFGGDMHFMVGNLTNNGYDFLELIRNEEIWVKTNEEVKKKKLPQTIESFGTIAGSFAGAFMREYTK